MYNMGKKISKMIKGHTTGPLNLYREEIIWEFYNACSKNRDKTEIRLNLQPIGYPSPVTKREEVLRNLKKEKIIESYKIEIKQLENKPLLFEEPVDPEITLSPFASLEDYKNAKKVPVLLEQKFNEYVAIIKCDPRKVIEALEKEYKRIDEKRKKIKEREKVESFFQKEQVLKCSGLKFGLESGNAVYGGTIANFTPDEQEYKILKMLMENPNKRVNYEKLCQAILGKQNKQCKSEIIDSVFKRRIAFIVRNIKRKLEIVRAKNKNKDLFKAGNGYMIICD
jgi:hypothetical protein